MLIDFSYLFGIIYKVNHMILIKLWEEFMRRSIMFAITCIAFFMCMTTVTHADQTAITARVNSVAKTGWQFTNGNWYYFDGDGNMQTGWISYNG